MEYLGDSDSIRAKLQYLYGDTGKAIAIAHPVMVQTTIEALGLDLQVLAVQLELDLPFSSAGRGSQSTPSPRAGVALRAGSEPTPQPDCMHGQERRFRVLKVRAA
jgi:hypothetical protein